MVFYSFNVVAIVVVVDFTILLFVVVSPDNINYQFMIEPLMYVRFIETIKISDLTQFVLPQGPVV